MYKILAKLLANRLMKVTNLEILENQSAFMDNKQILDNILIPNEAVDFMKKENQKGLLFKVDFKKAYDLVLWEYLE